MWSLEGQIFVLSARPKFTLLATNDLGEPIYAGLAVSEGAIELFFVVLPANDYSDLAAAPTRDLPRRLRWSPVHGQLRERSARFPGAEPFEHSHGPLLAKLFRRAALDITILPSEFGDCSSNFLEWKPFLSSIGLAKNAPFASRGSRALR